MSRETERWAAAALGFAAAVMWTTVGAGAALTCLVAAGLCAGATFAREGGLGSRLSGAVAGTKRLAQAAVPTPPPARVARQEQRRRPKPEREQRRPTPAPAASVTAPVLPPYDHDVPSGEHVYEVANYGW